MDLTLTTHAEMNAIDTMVADGEKKIKKLLIVMASNSQYPMPCGLCRQKMHEFALSNMEIIGINLNKKHRIKNIFRTAIEEMLPYPFEI